MSNWSMNVNEVPNENLSWLFNSVRHSPKNRHDMQSLFYHIYTQVIHAFCTSDTYKHTTIIPVVKKMSTNTIRGKWRVIVTDSRNSTWQIKIHTITSLEIHTMGLTCSFLLPAQTETHMKSTMSQRVQVVCVYIASLSLSLSGWHGLFLDRLPRTAEGGN